MAQTLKLKRGNNANLSSLTLEAGELAFVLDTGKLYVGDGTNKVLINPDVESVGTADKLATARTISLTGDVTGSASFDGSVNKSISATLANSGVTAGTYPKVTVDAKGRGTGGASLAATDIPTLTLSKISDAGTAAKVNTGTASGNVPVLDTSGKLSSSVLPAIAITDTFVVASEAAMLALSAAETGDVAVRTDLNKSFILKATPYSTLANWQELLTPASPVQSVNGQTGAVTITDITGNAGTATKLGTSTVGSTTLPIYLNSGTPTALTQANLRIGTIGTSAIGSTTLPVYFAANGVPTALTQANLRTGVFGSTAIGSSTQPVYFAANGVPTVATGVLNSSSTIDGGTF